MSCYQQYDQPNTFSHMPPPNPNSSMAVTSLVFGILSYVCLGFLAAIPAIICGHMALGQIRRGEVSESNRGLAIGGLVLGYINIILTVLAVLGYLVFFIFFAAAFSAGGAASM